MEKPLISVVTLTYKKFDYIYKAIDSVLNQTYPYVEYIISDDGSPNFPQNEIEDYVSNRKGKNIIKFSIISSLLLGGALFQMQTLCSIPIIIF